MIIALAAVRHPVISDSAGGGGGAERLCGVVGKRWEYQLSAHQQGGSLCPLAYPLPGKQPRPCLHPLGFTLHLSLARSPGAE